MANDYESLYLGSKGALEPATPTPMPEASSPLGIAPAGFGGQGVLSKPDLSSVTPPDFYRPSRNSLVGQEQDQSLFSKITGALMNAGTQPGELPVTMKMQLATSEVRHKQLQDELAWKNYNRSQLIFQNTLEEQKRDNIMYSMSIMPNAIAQIRATGDPELKNQIGKWYADNMNALAPGTGSIVEHYVKNPFHVSMWQALMADPKSPVASQLRELTNSVGFEHVLDMPEGQEMIKILGHDAATTVIAHMPKAAVDKLATGKMGEEEFKAAYKQTMYDPNNLGWGPALATAGEAFLGTPAGQQLMVGKGVQTNELAIAQQKKGYGSNPMNALKFKEFETNQFKIDHADELGLSTSDVQKLQAHNDRLMTYTSPVSQPGESKSSLHSSALFDLSGGLYQTKQDILDKTPEGSPARKQGLAWADQATQVQKTYSAQSQLGARMQEPAKPEDLSNMFSGKALLSGHRLEPVAPQSTMELRTNPDNIKVTPDEQVKYGNIIKSKTAGKALFEMAAKVYTAKSGNAMAKQQSTDLMFNSTLTAGAGALINPQMKVYHDILEAWAGNNAKALGGEVGVLTNVDIDRWVRTFPGGSDTPTTIMAKRKIFEQMTDLVRETQEGILAGRLSVVRDAEGFITNKDIRQKIEGLIGSAEGLTKDEVTGPTAKSRADALLQRMQGN